MEIRRWLFFDSPGPKKYASLWGRPESSDPAMMIALTYLRGRWPRFVSLVLGIILSVIADAEALRAQKRPQEEVTVTAVEVPVRVLLHGRAVRDLTKEHFEVYENGVKQVITHLEIVSQRISGPPVFAPEPGRLVEAPKPKKRVFLILLSVFDYTENVGDAIDYLYQEVFRPGDRVVIVSETQVLNADPGKTMEEAAGDLKESLKQFRAISNARTLKIFRDLRFEADRLIETLGGAGVGTLDVEQQVLRFVNTYRMAWKNYSAQYLKPDLAFYENLIGKIRTMEGEKWAICLQQREMFPQIKNWSRLDHNLRVWIGLQIDPQLQIKARTIQIALDELNRDFNVTGAVPTDALREVFLRAGIPLHLVLMKSRRTLQDEDLELKEVAQDYEDALRQISRATGGYLAFNNQPLEALKEAAQVEDYHYVLVYADKDPGSQAKREIKVKVLKEDVEVISLKTYVAAGPPPLTITDFRAGNGTVSFTIGRYQMTGGSDGRQGQAEVRITVYNAASGLVFDEGKVLDVIKKQTKISLNFNRLGRGKFFIIIRAIDKLTNQSDVHSGMIEL